MLELQRSLHSPPEATSWGLGDGETEFDVLVTTGSQHGLSTVSCLWYIYAMSIPPDSDVAIG